jgi:hypothetical protein
LRSGIQVLKLGTSKAIPEKASPEKASPEKASPEKASYNRAVLMQECKPTQPSRSRRLLGKVQGKGQGRGSGLLDSAARLEVFLSSLRSG